MEGQEAAGDVQGGVDQEVAPLDPGWAEGDPAGMAEEPGPLFIKGGDPLLDAADPEGDRKSFTLGSQGGAIGVEQGKGLPLPLGRAGV